MSGVSKVLPLALAVVVVALAVLAASCGSTSTQLRIVQAISNTTTNVDYTLNGNSLFTDVGFETTEPSSGYKGVSGGTDTFVVYPTGTTSNALINSPLNLGSSNSYTVVLEGFVGESGSIAPAASVLTDNDTAPTSGNSFIRVIDASTYSEEVFPNLDVYLVPPGTPLGSVKPNNSSPLTYGQSTGYLTVTPPSGGTLEMDITATGAKFAQLTEDYTVNPSGVQIRTIILIDVQGGGGFGTPIILSDLN